MKYSSLLLLCFCLLLTSCSSSNYAPVRQGSVSVPKNQNEDYPVQKAFVPKADYYKIPKQVQCVPYARDVSGIQIRGNAHTWWDKAEGKGYKRGKKPKKGAVFVLADTKRLRNGHLSVVKRVVDSRLIEVEHANWGGTMAERCIVYRAMPVQDVSKNNDWSLVRFWNYPSGTYGSLYKGNGFIYPKPTSRNHVVSKR